MTERPPISTLYYATRMTMGNRRMEASIITSDDFRQSSATLQWLYVQGTWGEWADSAINISIMMSSGARLSRHRGQRKPAERPGECMVGENTKWE